MPECALSQGLQNLEYFHAVCKPHGVHKRFKIGGLKARASSILHGFNNTKAILTTFNPQNDGLDLGLRLKLLCTQPPLRI